MEKILTKLSALGFKIKNHTNQSILAVWFNNDIVLTVKVEAYKNIFQVSRCKVEGYFVTVEKDKANANDACELILQLFPSKSKTDTLSLTKANT